MTATDIAGGIAAASAAGLAAPGPGILASAASGIGYGCANLFGGLAARRQPVLLTVACSQSVALVLVTVAATLRPGTPTTADLEIGAAAGAAAFAGAYLAYRCFRTAQLAICAVLLGLAQLAVPAAAGTLADIGAQGAGDGIAPGEVLGLGVAALAVAVLASGRSGAAAGASRDTVRAALLALGAGVAFGAYHATIAGSGSSSGLWPVVAAEAVIVIAAWTGTAAQRIRPGDRGAAGLAAGDGAVSAIATLTGLIGVRAAALPTAGALLALLPPVTTVVLARLVLHQQQPRRSAIGLALAGAAMVLLAST